MFQWKTNVWFSTLSDVVEMDTVRNTFGSLTESAKTTFGASTGSYVLPIIAATIGIALIVLVIMVVVQIRKISPSQVVKGPLDLFTPKPPVVIDRTTAKSSMNGTYTLAFYLRVDAVPDMRTSATPLFTWPGVWDLNYNAAKEELQWIIKETYDGQSGTLKPDAMTLPNVPLQRWTQVTIAFEGRTFDLYVNGKLIKSHTLNNVPPSANSSITIVPGGIMGQLAYVQLWGRRLTVRETESNYIDTSDSQGRPFLGPDLMNMLSTVQVPNLFCPSGSCTGAQPTATPSQTWEFPYA
jgi:hypothetical protein